MSETPQQYTARIVGNVGGRDPREILASTPARLRALLDAASADTLSRAPAPGRWSVAEIVAHLADAEIVGAWRFRSVLAQDGVALQAYDQNAWADAFRYARADPAESLELFTALRRSTLGVLSRVDPARLAHAGLHEERGRESVAHLMVMYAGHDLNHVTQIEALVRA